MFLHGARVKRPTFTGVVFAGVAACLLAAGWFGAPPEERAGWLIAAGLAKDCPPGFHLDRDGDGRECEHLKSPEPFSEVNDLHNRVQSKVAFPNGRMPLPGAYRASIAAREAMAPLRREVTHADTVWAPYGVSTLIVNDSRYSSVNGEGYVYNSGRVDSLEYDPVNKRLFATTGGTGGVWMSTDLGQHWASVGDSLPSQVVGSVAWTSYGGTNGSGGTIVVAAGDPSFGGGDYAGLGAFWSSDLGVTWNYATGVPDGVLGFRVAVDHAHPNIVYLALSKGLFRSTDGGRSYVNVALPTSTQCAGVTDIDGPCQFANFVTDVVVMEPGGTTNEPGGNVLAAVGYRAGPLPLPDPEATPSSPGNGLYASADGTPGSFTYLSTIFASNDTTAALGLSFPTFARTGRIALGPAIGPAQDHNYLYAAVQDATLFNGGFPSLGLPDNGSSLGTNPLADTLINGIYVSADFGNTWMQMASTEEIANNPTSALTATGAIEAYAPGIQAYYNLWIKPDPTAVVSAAAASADPTNTLAAPTRLAFGLEEVFSNAANVPLIGHTEFTVVGDYRTSTGVTTAAGSGTTTHPDQHAAVWVPDTDGSGGVTLIVGNDGGAFSQHITSTGSVSQSNWANGIQTGFNTLLPYGIAVANDGVVYFGLQDNGSGKIDTDNKYYETYGGDGFYVTVDPANSLSGWEEYTYGDMRYTLDGGQTWTSNAPTLTGANFDNLFVQDPTDATHMFTAANEVQELLNAPTGTWTQVFSLGTNAKNQQNNVMSSLDLYGDSAYVGFCGICDLLNRTQYQFYNGLATNVGGNLPAKRGTGNGWHFASINGLPNRYIQAIAIDPATPTTVYVGLSGYANRQWVPPGSYLDTNKDIGSGHVFKSTDAGENFTDITGNLPDANVSAIKLRRGQLYVGTDIGAFISSDTTGALWAPLGTGLPNVPVNQFQFQNNDDTQLFIAAYGRSVYHTTLIDAATTTGGTSGGTTSGGSTGGSTGGASSGGSTGGSTGGASSGGSTGGSTGGASSGGSTGGSTGGASSGGSTGGSTGGTTTGGSMTLYAPSAALSVTPNSGTAPLTVTFSAAASTTPNAGATVTEYTFNFGDGSALVTQSSPSVSHTYSSSGGYTATLVVTDSDNQTSTNTSQQSVQVLSPSATASNPPTAALSASPSSGTGPLAVTFSGSASSTPNSGAAISSYTFDFGDGSTSVTQASATVSHTYTAPGSFTASLTVTDSTGRSSFNTSHVSISVVAAASAAPSAALSASPASGVAPLTVNFNASASTTSNPGASISSYTFNFGDGSSTVTQSTATVTHQYTAAGGYAATVTVVDSTGQGSTNSAQQRIAVSGTATATQYAPLAALSAHPASGNSPLTVDFDGSASSTPNRGATVTTYVFNFGDGSASVSQSSATASHTYTTAGSYTATLVVSDSDGQSSTNSAQQTIRVSSASTAAETPPNADLSATPNRGPGPLTVAFDGSASAATTQGASLTRYSFRFGDGSTALQSTPTVSHTYSAPGTYTATLGVTDSDGQTSSNLAQQDIIVEAPSSAASPNPSAALSATPSGGMVPLTVSFSGAASTASTPGATVTGYVFNFGDGSPARSQPTATVSHVYSAIGTYSATLVVTDSNGGTSSNSSRVTITVGTAAVLAPDAALSASPNAGAAPLTVTLIGSASTTANPGATITGYTFGFGDGSAAVTQSSPTVAHVYAAAGSYTATLSVTDSDGQTSNEPAQQAINVQDASTGSGNASDGKGGGGMGLESLFGLGLAGLLRQRRGRRQPAPP